MNPLAPPLALQCELTHRCPLRCVYCSNPLQLDAASDEMPTAAWLYLLDQAAAMGILQVHFSGGEPAARNDLERMVAHTTLAGLYANLITSGVSIGERRLDALAAAGLDHVQVSFQDSDGWGADRISGYAGGLSRKLLFAHWVRARGLALTVNAVITRHNAGRLRSMIDLAVEVGAGRIEVANVQYYGWGLLNRAALMPSRRQVMEMTAVVEAAREELKGVLLIDYVVPDYYARRPKACMGGWGRRFIHVTPSGKALPCHGAETIPGLVFDRVQDRQLAEIWTDSMAFRRYRGIEGLPAACRTCPGREIDWGGCRCQALALTGSADAIDPTCEFSPHNAAIQAMAGDEAEAGNVPLIYRTAGDQPSPRNRTLVSKRDKPTTLE
jgi:PqqA peptide cyclase